VERADTLPISAYHTICPGCRYTVARKLMEHGLCYMCRHPQGGSNSEKMYRGLDPYTELECVG
jgi:hypothetical protein